MVRRAFLRRLALAADVASAGGGAAAADPVDDIVAEIRSQGFKIQHLQKTWLGRVRIIATNRDYRREVVIDPTTGEIRRDLLLPRTDAGNTEDGPPVPAEPSPAPTTAPTTTPAPTRSQAAPADGGAARTLAGPKVVAQPVPAAAPDSGAARAVAPSAAAPTGATADWGGGWGALDAPAKGEAAKAGAAHAR